MTPTDEIPFTRGMAATIAAGLDHAGAHTSATDVRKQAGLVPTPQPAPHPKPYTEATRWACAVSWPHTNDYRIFNGKVQFNPLIIGEQWSNYADGYPTVDDFLSAEQRGEVVRVGEADHIAEVSKMVPEANSGGYRAGYAAAESKAGDTIAAFTDTVSKVAASLEGPLANMGPVPNKAQNQLLITSTAVGSFGFQLEEHRDEALLIDDGSAVGEALAATQTLLEATAGDDDSLAEAAAGMEPRAIAAARAFLTVLADNEAVCAVSVGGKSFGFTDVGQVQRAVARLATENLIEGQATKTGEFQGVLPKSRTFEFKLSGTNEVIKGRIGPGVINPDALNDLLHKPMTITLAETRVGAGKPRYTLNTTPAFDAPASGQGT